MALTQESINDAELAKGKIAQADNLNDDYKRNLINLINISTLATNGISPEEKIQKMTDAIRILAVSQVDFITTIKDTIITTIEKVTSNQCSKCKALKHAEEFEAEQEKREFLEQWKKENGIQTERDLDQIPFQSIFKKIILKPWCWIFAAFLVFSPYCVDIIKAITDICTK